MKRISFLVVLLLALVLATAALAEPLVVGTQPKPMGLPVRYAMEKGFFAEEGLEIELMIFPTGAPINEAMAAEQLDIAVSGMASCYALATGSYTYIGDTQISRRGEAVYGRADSPMAQESGAKENVLGSAETVKGISILGPLATAAHYNAIRYVQNFGLTSEDFDMVSMDFSQAYQAFLVGEGDAVATTPPYSFQLEDQGYVKLADLYDSTGFYLSDGNYVQNTVLAERRDDIAAFVRAYYRAVDEMVAYPERRVECAMKWYAEEGVSYSDSDMQYELETRFYTTSEEMRSENYVFGATMVNIGAFFTDEGLIDPDDLPNIAASMDASFVNDMLGIEVAVAH